MSVEEKEKSGLFVQDLDLLLNYHWVRDKEVFAHERLRLQLALVLIIAGATSTRPGALMSLRYKDITFALFPPQSGEDRPHLAMRLRLRETKTRGGQRRPTAFGFHEEISLIHCPVLGMLALAIADGAFKNNVECLSKIYTLRVPPTKDRLPLDWKPEWNDRPIFRQMDGDPRAHYQYAQAQTALKRLGYSCGYLNPLAFYDLRRASGKKLNEQVTPEERNQIMGHSGGTSSVWRRFYMPEYVDRDVQSIYFGSTPQSELIRAIGRIPRDSTAPTKLTAAQKESVKRDAKLAKAIQIRDSCKADIRRRYTTVAKAQRTPEASSLVKKYTQARKNASKVKVGLERELLRRSIQEHHKRASDEEIQRQLKGLYPQGILAPPDIHYELPERQRIATIFSQASDCPDKLDHFRVELVAAMAALCKRRETPNLYRAQADPKATAGPKSPADLDEETQSDKPTWTCFRLHERQRELTCPFCAIDAETGPIKKSKLYARIDSLGNHIFKQHFNASGCYVCQGEPHSSFVCPFPACTQTLYGARDFASHACTRHGSGRFPESTLPEIAPHWANMVAQF